MKIIQSNLLFGALNLTNKPGKIVLHHAEATRCTIEDIHRWHKDRGWSGCGYHYFVRKDGSIYKGRPDNAIGSHCKNNNLNSLGICAEGAYMSEIMPVAQKNAIIELGVYLRQMYGIKAVYGHKELNPSDCPGTNYPLAEIKNAIMSNTGWRSINGIWYYFENGSSAKNTWRQDRSMRWFYLGADGAMIKNAWAQDSHGWCYCGADGAWDGVHHKEKGV